MYRVSRHIVNFVQHAYAAPQGIDFDLLSASLAAQKLFPSPL
jgi:hypothetical protein